MSGAEVTCHGRQKGGHLRFVFAALAALAAAAVIGSDAGAVSLQYHTQVADADFYVSGGPGDLLGNAIAAGRYNGDNRSDLVVCSASNNSCWLYYGRTVAGPSGSMGAPDIIFVGPGGRFGASVAFLGDLNGDGAEDLGVGAPNSTGENGVLVGGSLWIFFGRKDNFGGSIGYYDAATTVFGAEAGDNLGFSSSPAGDIDRDGFGDFWVSAPNASEAGSRVGEALLFRGRQSWPAELNRQNASLRVVGVVPSGEFGRVLLGKADLDGDGRLDLATSTTRYRDGSGTAVGAAFAFLGPLPVDGRTVNATRANITYWGDVLAPSVGASLAFAPNFTKDAGRYLLIGAPVYINGTSSGGSVELFQVNATPCCRSLHRWDAVGLLYTTEPGDQAGAAAAAVGDIDGDGRDDLIVGAPNAEVGNKSDAGRVFIVYGNDTSRQPVLLDSNREGLEGPAARTQLGAQVLLADFSGDGLADLLVGAPGDTKGTSLDGVVYAFVGRPRNRPPVVSIEFEGNRTEGVQFLARANITDPDGDRLEWEWMIPSDGDDHGGEVAVQLNFTDEGLFAVYLRAFDGTLYGEAVAWAEVANAAPWCNITADRGFVEGTPGTLRVRGGDLGRTDRLWWTWTGPEGMLSNNTTAVYTPPRGLPFNVSVTVADEDGGSSRCVLPVIVQNVAPTVSIHGPGTLTEGNSGLYSAEVSDPGSEDQLFINWTSGLGTANTSTYLYAPRSPGNHVLQARVSDLDGGESFASFTVHVVSVDPDCALLGPNTAGEGEAVLLEVRQYTGADFDPIVISWDTNITATQDGFYLRIPRAPTGTFTITALVSDDDYDYARFTHTLTVTNRDPLEGIRARPPAPYLDGQTITLDAIVGAWETTPTVRIQYVWTLDGVKFSVQRSTSFQAVTGKHQIAVAATDDQGATSQFFLRIEVVGIPPTVRITGPSQLIPGAIGTWGAEASDSSGSPVNLTWDVDGVPITTGPELQWGTPAQGTHIVRVTARDSSGEATVATILVSVSPPPPTAAGIDVRWVAIPLGAAAAFAAGILLGAYVIGRLRERKPRE